MSSSTLPARRNGVDTATLFATLDAVRAQPALAAFRFRATTEWRSGTHNATTIHAFHGAGGEQTHRRAFAIEADHPDVLVGEDHAPTAAEHLLQALGACVMSGLGNIAAARGIDLDGVTAYVEGDIDLRGILGLDDSVRNGFSGITVRFELEGDADDERLERLVHQAVKRSAVYDAITNGVPIEGTATGVPAPDLHGVTTSPPRFGSGTRAGSVCQKKTTKEHPDVLKPLPPPAARATAPRARPKRDPARVPPVEGKDLMSTPAARSSRVAGQDDLTSA